MLTSEPEKVERTPLLTAPVSDPTVDLTKKSLCQAYHIIFFSIFSNSLRVSSLHEPIKHNSRTGFTVSISPAFDYEMQKSGSIYNVLVLEKLI